MATLQEILNNKYSSNKGTEEIRLENQGSPTGALDLKEYVNLKQLHLFGNGIDSENYLKIIQSIPNKDKIIQFGLGGNKISDPRFDYVGANFPNLEWLSIGNISDDTSMKGLEKLKKLKELYVGAGEKKFKDMEYLPISLTSYNDVKTEGDFFKGLKTEAYKREATARKPYTELNKYLVDNYGKIVNDPFLLTFKDTRTLEEKITALEKGKADLATERDTLKTDNAKKDTALAEKDNTISNLNQQIAKATTVDEEKLKLLQNELTKKNELIAQLNQYKEEILKTKRVNVKKELTLFYQRIGLDDDPLKKKYNGDFISIINEKLTLDNEENMKKAFKVVACICATEKAQDKENNSFYLDIIAKRQEYKKEFDGLIGKYKQTKKTIEVRGLTGQSTVSLSAKDLAEERTIFQISKKEGIKEKFKGYLDLLKKEYPGTKEAIEKIENEQEVKENFENYSDGTNTED
ncbi:15419_t:CDS:2 [Funneliformis geosporum]|uniref:1726_t:CDS:1 n=1 Tax=Funneliformis geosporum TaxID=1117311 RepID=A0A9W4SMP5_9GLOM|nr:1726_t:CDS:2 [Funneliformis geosporum]CAI2194992.1 15419_t:CDS:2 [Funneliformis geosporum]